MLPTNQQAALAFALKTRSERKNHDNLFDRLASMFLPRGHSTVDDVDGDDLFDHLNSSAPVLARRSLASATSTMMRPAGRPWFYGKARVTALNTDPNVRMWMGQVSQIMHDHMYDARAKMEPNLAMVDDELVTFANGCCRLGWDRKKKHLKYQARPMRSTYFIMDAVHEVVGIISFEKWTLRQCVERFGEKKISEEMAKELRSREPNMDNEYELVHIVLPTTDAKAMGMTFKKEYTSLWMSVKCRHTLESSGYDYFPYITPQWDKSTGEVYARGPGHVALGDAQLYQQATETFMNAGEKALNPPTWGYGDLINGEYDLTAGGFTSVDISAAIGNNAPVNTVQLGALPREMLEYLGMIEDRIGAAFYRDVLELPSARDADLTATEINARLDQYMRQAAPVFARIEGNYNAPHVMKVYKILEMEGELPPKPDVLRQHEEFLGEDGIEFDYESPIKLAREKSEAMKIVEGIQVIGQTTGTFGEAAMMQAAENFDPDAIARQMGPKLDLPEWCYKPADIMKKEREERMKQQQMQAEAEMANKAAPAINAAANVGGLVPKSAQAGLFDTNGDDFPMPSAESIDFSEIEGIASEVF